MIKNTFAVLCLFSFSYAGLWAQCPSQNNITWAQNSVVYYSLDGSITGTELTQIQQAFSDWNSADTNGNDSGVTFAPADANHPAVWTWTNGTTATGVGASSTINSDPNTDLISSVTTTVGINTSLPDGSPIYSPTQTGYSTIFAKAGRHEIGHTLGLGDVGSGSQVAGDSVMNSIHGTNDSQNFMPTAVQNCDNQTVNNSVTFNPRPPNPPPPHQRPCLVDGDGCPCDDLCSPIIIDTEGLGFHLTAAEDGVMFDISGTGKPIRMGWTRKGYQNAFLALPGPDGLVHNGKELFGNFTPQPPSDHPNGFIALAEYDKPEKGGNGDGLIDEKDAVYSKLRLWIDENHDGICQPNELRTLPELGVYSLSFDYRQSHRTDAFGNQFRYKALVNPGERRDFRDERRHGEENEVGRWAYDVFFATTNK